MIDLDSLDDALRRFRAERDEIKSYTFDPSHRGAMMVAAARQRRTRILFEEIAPALPELLRLARVAMTDDPGDDPS